MFDLLRQNAGLGDRVLGFACVTDEPWSFSEQFLHLLQGQLFGLRKYGPKEDGICEIADLNVICQLPVKHPPRVY